MITQSADLEYFMMAQAHQEVYISVAECMCVNAGKRIQFWMIKENNLELCLEIEQLDNKENTGI